MRSCLILASLMLTATASAAAANAEERPHRISLTVRADPRTGRLVRAPVVASKPVHPVPVSSRVIAPRQPSPVLDLEAYIEQVAARYELDPLLVRAVIEVESAYNPFAVSPKGARGLMQLMPQTARRLGVRDSFNPWENVEGGVRYLKYLLEMFHGDQRLALAAYNAGEGAVFRYGGIPPYPETAWYIYRVGKKLGEAVRAGERQRAQPPVEAFPKVVEYIDPDGRWHIQTRLTP